LRFLPRSCVVCATEFQPTNGRQRICGAEACQRDRWRVAAGKFRSESPLAATARDRDRQEVRRRYRDDPEYRQKYRDERIAQFGDYKTGRFVARRVPITREKFEEMLRAQNGVCAICGHPETARRGVEVKRLAIDHDAETNAIRGLLCSRCNTAIGLLGHDVARIAKAIEYLARAGDERRREAVERLGRAIG
jgi:hypothetical protein